MSLTRSTRHLIFAFTAFSGLGAAAGAAHAETVTQLSAPGNDRYYRISEPNVSQRETEYPEITFEVGETVRFRAGGCVQTGGRGLTWKRYVHPYGPKSDRYYHGLFQIPGAMSNLASLSDFVDDGSLGTSGSGTSPWSAVFTVRSSLPNMALRLGYTDDQYDDNGYWGHDDGTQRQCEGIGNAWLEVYITGAR
jgi:hypothetical protein